MANLQDFQKRDRRPCYCLRIAGLDVLYGTHMPFDITSYNGSYQDTMHRRAAIVPGSVSFSRRYDENRRIVTVENLRIRLTSNAMHSNDSHDPAVVFSRTGYRHAEVFSRILSTVGQTTSDTNILFEDASNFAVGDIFHINAETLKVYSVGYGGNPNILRCERGRYGTIPMLHQVDQDAGSYPYATKPLCYFRGRRVTLYEGYVELDGSVSPSEGDYIEVFKGFIATEPEVARDGRLHTIELELAPLTAVFDKPLPVSRKSAKMHQNLHAFDGLRANNLFFCAYVGEGWVVDDTAILGVGQSQSGVDIWGLGQIDDVIENIDTVYDNEVCDFHPRGFAMTSGIVLNNRILYMLENVGASASSLNYDKFYSHFNTVGSFDLMPTFYHNFPANLKNRPAFDVRCVRMDGGSVPQLRTYPYVRDWHKYLRDRVLAEVGKSTIKGASGYWFHVSYDPNREVFTARSNCTTSNGTKLRFGLAISNSAARLQNFVRSIDSSFSIVERYSTFSSSYAHSGKLSDNVDHSVGSGIVDLSTYESQETSAIPAEALNCVDGDTCLNIVVETTGEANSAVMGELHAPLAKAFYCLGVCQNWDGQPQFAQGFEKWICLDNDSLTNCFVSVRKNDDLIAILELGTSTSTSVDGFSGYYYKVNSVQKFQDVSVICDYPGGQQHEFIATVQPADDFSMGGLVLSLLQSMNGTGATGSYDVLPFGAGLLGASSPPKSDMGIEIDEWSFLRMQSPLGTLAFAPDFFEGDTLGDLLSGLLSASGYTVDLRTTSKGLCVLQAVEIGLPDVSQVVKTFDESIISDSPAPSSTSELSIKNVFKFSSNYDLQGEPQIKQTIKDQVSIDLFNEARDLSVDLKGIRLPIRNPGEFIAAVRPIYNKLRIENSYPRRVYTLEVPSGELHGLSLGDTCMITHSMIQGIGGIGLTSLPGRVRSISFDGYSATGSVELVSYGVSGTGWNHAAIITGMDGTSTTTVIIDKSALVPMNVRIVGMTGTTPTTESIYATDYFQEGQTVLIIPLRGTGITAPFLRTIDTITLVSSVLKVAFTDSVATINQGGFGALAIMQPVDQSTFDNDFAYIGDTVAT